MSGYLHWLLAATIQVALAEIKCGNNQFACDNGEVCINMEYFCDDINDCGDNSDEISRNKSEVQTGIPCRRSRYVCMLPERYLSRKDEICVKNLECDDNKFSCSDGSACLYMQRFCDGSKNCNDNSDHIRRNNSEVQPGIPCRRDEYVCMLPERYLSRKDDFCKKNPECDENEFACSDGSKCIGMNRFCQDHQNCDDRSDRILRNKSEIQTGIPCRQHNFVCMLPERYMSRKSDICKKNPECAENEFACSDGSACLDMNRFCTYHVYCNDKSDHILRNNSEVQTGIPCRRAEHVCMLPERYISRKDDLCTKNPDCDENEFACSDGSACLGLGQFCDSQTRHHRYMGHNDNEDCIDRSDEIRRNYSLTQDGLACRTGKDICMLPYNQASKKALLCTKNLNCDDNKFACSDGSACLKLDKFCDGHAQCKDGSDEIKRYHSISYQDSVPCRPDIYVCMLPYNQASRKALLCTKNPECEDSEFMCENGSECIPLNGFCDGTKNCSDGSDEIMANSSDSGIRCRLHYRVCILPDKMLARKEKFCKKDVNCDDNQFRCADGNQCLAASEFCDGRKDCDDGSDEVLFKIYSSVSGIKCPGKNIICVLPLSQGDKQDQLCSKEFKCAANEFACLDGSGCLPKEKFCDGTAHCGDESDEMKEGSDNPAAVDGSRCRRDKYKCILPDNQKSKKTYICEKKFECADNEFECLDNTQCLPSWWFCDGYADCGDGSDEMSAASQTNGLVCRQGRHVCLLPKNQISKKVNFCRRPV